MQTASRLILRLVVAAFSIAAVGSLQAQAPDWLFVVQDEDNISEVRNGNTLTFEAEGSGDLVTQRLTITYQGPVDTLGTVNDPSLGGSTTFAVTSGPTLPRQLGPGQSVDFTISFLPTNVGPFSSRLDFGLTRSNFGRPNITTNVLLNLSGLVADYSLSYQLPGGNEILIPDGGAVPFDDTEVETTQTATIIVTNRGSGPGTVETVNVDGGVAFSASGLQLLPAEVNAGASLRFSIIFEPPQEGAFMGSAAITFGLGSRSLNLIGAGVAASFTYEKIIDGQSMPVMDREAISIPPAAVGEETLFQMKVTNAGSLEGTIQRISVAGTGFALDDLPVIPQVMDPAENFTFTVKFTPPEPGETSGQLLIGDARFDLIGVGEGSQLTFSSATESGSSELRPGETVVFSQTPLGLTSETTFSITNSGNAAQAVSLVGSTGASFSLLNLPTLPLSLEQDQTVSFQIVFDPAGPGPQSGSLSIDSSSFPLSGVGGDPAPLPTVTIGGPGGKADPATQVEATVELAEPYGLDVTGTLQLDFSSDAFSNDPSIQFSTGGRTVRFRIAEGQTKATFTNNDETVRFQTGTVAGSIALSATLEMDRSSVDLTPDPEPELAYFVDQAAPVLAGLSATRTGAGFNVFATGFSTARSVTSMEVSITADSGKTLDTSRFDIDVTTPFTAWYTGGQSSSFGSGFTATVSFILSQGDVLDLQSLTVTATNALGESAPITINAPE